MRILIITNSSSGLFNFRQMLIKKLLENHEVIAYSPFNGSEKNLINLGCQMHELKIDRRGMNPFHDWWLYHNIYSILRKNKPDLVITYTIKPNIYACYASRRLGISYAANITGLGTAFEKGMIMENAITALYRLALKKAKVVFFENDSNRQLFIKKRIISKEKTCLLMGAGVDLEKFTPLSYPQNDVFHFLFIGRIMKEKGIDVLFEATERLYNEGNSIVLDICGSYEENYKEIIEKKSKERWLLYHGRQDDVRPFIGRADCFVLPSYHEGMANTNLECASSGRPIITSNIPGCREAVVNGSGLLCEPRNVDSLYKAMKTMYGLSREEREQMGLIGRKHMEDIFDKKKVVAETLKYIL